MARARPITEAEFRRTMAMAGTSRYPERNQLCLALSARAGMRVDEIRCLDVSDVYDGSEEEVRDRIYLTAQRTKWGHAREVHLNRTVKRLVEAYLSIRGFEEGPLILTQSRNRFARTAFVGLFSAIYRNAGIETSSHAGRALFICSLADAGISIRIIQRAVGHKTLAATNAYLSARPREVRNAVELLR